jgi:hypothetical protein
MCKTRDTKLWSLLSLLIPPIVEGPLIRRLNRRVNGVYCPSYFVSYFFECFTVGRLERLDAGHTFAMLSDIFKDSWLYESFLRQLHLYQVFA